MYKVVFYLLLLSTFYLQSQSTFNKVYHDKIEAIGPLLTNIYGDYYYSANNYNYNDYGKCYIYRYSNTGNLKAKIPLPTIQLDFHLLNAGIKTNDNKLLVIGHTLICDVLDSAYIRTFISKLDTNGNVLFITKVKRQFGFYTTDNFKSVLQNTDSTYCAFTDSTIYKFSKTGQLLFRKNLGTDSITSCVLLQNNNILLSAKQSGNKLLFIISPNGNFISLFPFPSLLKKMNFYSGQRILGLGLNGRLYKIQSDFTLLGSSPVSLPAIKDFISDSDTIFSISNNNYSLIDTSFNVLTVSTNTTQKVNQLAICKNNNLIGITAGCSTGGTTNYHSFTSINVINKNGNTNFTNDLEVVSVTPDSLYCIVNGLNDFISYLKAKVKVKNKGSVAIHKFTLNLDPNATGICGPLHFQQTFTQTLQPGDSAIIQTPFMFKRYMTITPTTPTLSIQYCLFSTMPNGENDKFIVNDELCKSFVFQNPTASIHGLNDSENKLNIYPNPFGDEFAIESTFIIKKIEVYNSLSALIYINTPGKTTFIFNNQINKGIYFVKIETEKGTQIKKVVKQ